MAQIKLELYNLHKKFGEKVVLDSLDIKVHEGETHVIIGQSGVGKSVMLKLMIGILQADSGKIYIDGIDYSEAEESDWVAVRKQFGMLFQGGALFDSLTVGQNILFALEHLKSNLTEDQKEHMVLQALDHVNLPGVEDLMPSELSGGMMKRVALARAIVAEPAIVLFDEPTTGLDPIMTANINELITDVKKKLKTTFIVVTHDLESAKLIADRISMLYKGKIVFEGTPSELDSSNDPFVHQFINGLPQGPITDEYFREIERIKKKQSEMR